MPKPGKRLAGIIKKGIFTKSVKFLLTLAVSKKTTERYIKIIEA